MTPAQQDFLRRMDEAVKLHRSGRRSDAIARYRQLRVEQPFMPPLLNLLGLALVQDGKVTEGLPLLADAVQRAPTFVDAWLNLAFARHQADDSEGAREAYRRILALEPNHLTAMMSYASLAAETDTSEAVALLRRATQLAPGKALPWLRLRRLCVLHGDRAGVAEADRQIATLRLESAEELAEAAGIHISQARYDRAAAFYREALRLRPDLGIAALGLGAALRQQGLFEEAKEAYRHAAALAPRRTDPVIGLGLVHIAQGDRAAAAVAFREALQRKPGDPVAQHMLDAALGHTSATAPAEYVKRTFDDFASAYESVLIRDLGYRAPEEIAALLQSHHPGRVFDRFFDVGCGTGLVARALAPITRRRVGLDLSHRMLELARDTGLYDDLIEQEATAYLASTQERYDLVVAAEVFVYIGDLAAFFDQLALHLDPGGVFVATTERFEEGISEAGFVLRESGRYAHRDSYLRQQAERCGLEVEHLARIDLRLERNVMVAGSLALFRKPG